MTDHVPDKAKLAERFWDKVDMTGGPNGCWLWLGSHTPTGYGCFSVNNKSTGAHRVAYQLMVGTIPPGLTVDHLCRVRNCVNPEHLELATQKDNTLRGNGPTARHARKTHCIHGHPFDEANTLIRPDGNRRCRVCRIATNAKRGKAYVR